MTGCGSGSDGNQASGDAAKSSTGLPPAPTAFDPCSSAMQPVLDSEHLSHQTKEDSDGNGGTQWRGCQWVSYSGDGYTVSIRSTNITLPMIRANNGFRVAEQVELSGRTALVYHNSDATDTMHNCAINAELKGGSLEFSLDNPASNEVTGSTDTCEIGKRLASKVVDLVPPSA
ncbi:MAG: DUF3558 domain-containing protein [Nocardia sp.]|nr:DUF3558 domain-containing protein [Nocardia sp.]